MESYLYTLLNRAGQNPDWGAIASYAPLAKMSRWLGMPANKKNYTFPTSWEPVPEDKYYEFKPIHTKSNLPPPKPLKKLSSSEMLRLRSYWTFLHTDNQELKDFLSKLGAEDELPLPRLCYLLSFLSHLGVELREDAFEIVPHGMLVQDVFGVGVLDQLQDATFKLTYVNGSYRIYPEDAIQLRVFVPALAPLETLLPFVFRENLKTLSINAYLNYETKCLAAWSSTYKAGGAVQNMASLATTVMASGSPVGQRLQRYFANCGQGFDAVESALYQPTGLFVEKFSNLHAHNRVLSTIGKQESYPTHVLARALRRWFDFCLHLGVPVVDFNKLPVDNHAGLLLIHTDETSNASLCQVVSADSNSYVVKYPTGAGEPVLTAEIPRASCQPPPQTFESVLLGVQLFSEFKFPAQESLPC